MHTPLPRLTDQDGPERKSVSTTASVLPANSWRKNPTIKWSLTFGVWQLLMVGLFGARITRSVTTQADEEGQIRDLIQRGLVLSSGPDSACEQFQLELRCREIREDGSVIERRCVVERSGSRFGVMFLSPRGYFTSAVLYQTRATFFAAEPDGIKVSQSGSFSFRAGCGRGRL